MWLQCANKQITKKSNKYLLVIAHPDDEVMFFSPLLQMATSNGAEAHILCLSNGNDEGLGDIRSEELIKSGSLRNIPKENITVINHNDLQDGMTNIWPITVVSNIVEKHIKRLNPNIVVTFDERGVSDHINHIAVFKGVQLAHSKLKSENYSVTTLKLLSKTTLRKLLGPFDLLFCIWTSEYVIFSFQLIQAILGMYAHRSQNLWYRQIFIVISSFTYMNSFAEIDK